MDACLVYNTLLEVGNRYFVITVFPLISAPSAYFILTVLGPALIGGWLLLEGGAYFRKETFNNYYHAKKKRIAVTLNEQMKNFLVLHNLACKLYLFCLS